MSFVLKIPDQTPAVHDAVTIFGNTLRVGIIRQLYLGKTSRQDISAGLNVSEVALTRHLSILVDAGLVTAEIIPGVQGRPVIYTINKEATNALFETLQAYYRGADLHIATSGEEEPE